jgi:hypothetical protein
MTPDRHIAEQLRRIDPKLSARWVKERGRWGVFYDAPFPGQVDKVVRENGLQLQLDLMKRGYVCTKRVCEEMAWFQLQDYSLVFYVCEEDGSYRPLDMRAIEKMRRMNYFRDNMGVKDWKQFMNAKADAQKRLRELAWEDFNTQVGKDRIYHEHMTDALRGDPHLRSVGVSQPEKPARYGRNEGESDAVNQCDTGHVDGEGVFEEATAARARGDCISSEVR